MIGVFFRIRNNVMYPNDWIGFAFAQNGADLYWQIEEFCDPNDVELKEADKCGVIFKTKVCMSYEIPKIKSCKVSDWLAVAANGDGWFKPEIDNYKIVLPRAKRGRHRRNK